MKEEEVRGERNEGGRKRREKEREERKREERGISHWCRMKFMYSNNIQN